MPSPSSSSRSLRPASAGRHLPTLLLTAFLPALFLLWPPPPVTAGPDDDSSLYEVDRREERKPAAHAPAQFRLSATPEWTRFLARHPGWVARWNEALGTVESASGPAPAAPGAALLPAGRGPEADRAVEMAARAFLASDLAPWLPSPDRLVFLQQNNVRGKRWVHFTQQEAGIPVFNSIVTLFMAPDGRVGQFTNRTYPAVNVPTQPAITADAAVVIARSGLPEGIEPLAAPSLAILPLARGDSYEFRLAWRVEFRTLEPMGHWINFVDASAATLLWRFNNAKSAAVSGKVTASIETETSNDVTTRLPLPYLQILVTNPDKTTNAAYTDTSGTYVLSTAGATNRTIRARLGGRFGRIYNAANGNATPAILDTLPAAASVTRDFHWDDTNSLLAERDPYWSAMISHDYIKTIEPEFNALDYPMPILVEINQTCNAYWDGTGINFFAAGGGCPASGRIATIVMHEYGHGITDMIYDPIYAPGDINEGWSDYYCCTIVNSPINGPGFHGPGTYVRRIDTDRQYPRDMTGEVHNDGLIIASALWDVREALGRETSDALFHFARYGRSQSFDDYFMDYLRVDDDDFDLYNGTPHFTVIANIFRKHGVGDFSIHVSHAGLPDTEDLQKVFPLTATFLSLFALAPGSVQAHITLAGEDGSYEVLDRAMTPTGGIREYTTLLEAQPAGTRVSYYFTARDTSGNTVTWPTGGATEPFAFRVGTDVTPPVVQHDALADQPADIPGVMVRAAVNDNLDLGVALVRVLHRVNGGAATTAAMTAWPDGSYRADLPVTGLGLGDLLEYRIEAVDAATTPNVRQDPPGGWHAFSLVRGFGRDFEADDGGLVGSGDWQWGDSWAWSGARAWTTALAGGYTDTTASFLELPPVDLSEFTRAALTFRHLMISEESYDGGVVEISVDGGYNWWPIQPDGDYNTPVVWSLWSPGWSGTMDAWSPAEFDLSAYRGFPDVRLRLHFESDEMITGPGWFVDDVQVVERQILSRPLALAVTNGRDGSVPLAWETPGGIYEDFNSPLLGYRVYRATTIDGGRVLLTHAPIAARRWDDSAVENGRHYYYWVSAVYPEGESPLVGPVEGYPYRPAFAADPGSVNVTMNGGSTAEVALTVTNPRTGYLRSNTYLATADQPIGDVRIALRTGGSGGPVAPAAPVVSNEAAGEETPLADLVAGCARARRLPAAGPREATPARQSELAAAAWDTLFIDPQEAPPVVPDLGAILVRQTADGVYFRINAWQKWGSPLTDFNFLILMDTDGNEATGFSGGDYMLVAGPLMFENFGVPALILDGNQNPVAWPLTVSMPDSATMAEFGIPKDAVGWPAEMILTFAALNAEGSVYYDRAPNRPTLAWLTTPARFVSATPDAPATLKLAFKTRNVNPGVYQARLYFDTNDPDRPLVLVPVTLTVNASVPVTLAGFEATCGPDGVLLSWRTGNEVEHLGFQVYRRQVEPEPSPEACLTEALLEAAPDGGYRFTDGTAAAGCRYEYRLADLSRSGQLTFHGPFPVTVPQAAMPARVWLGPATPNPARGAVVLRYGLPTPGPVSLRVFSVDGRLVRTVLDLPRAEAGYHDVSWDGCDDGGQPAGAGVYFYRLEAAGKTKAGKVMVAR